MIICEGRKCLGKSRTAKCKFLRFLHVSDYYKNAKTSKVQMFHWQCNFSKEKVKDFWKASYFFPEISFAVDKCFVCGKKFLFSFKHYRITFK